MFKKIGIGIAAASLVFALLYPQNVEAEGNPATSIGTKLAEKLATLILGEVFSSIFGGEDPAATPQQVQDIVNAGFNQAALDEIQTEIGSVLSSINAYNWRLNFTYNSHIIGEVISQTGTVQNRVGVHMNHNNFMSLIKTYMSASTLRLAFLSERRRYVKLDGQAAIDALTGDDIANKKAQMQSDLALKIAGENNIIASSALDSISAIANFFYEDFYEKGPSEQGCIYKYPQTPWSFPDGRLGSNTDLAGKDRATVTCRNYGPMLPAGARPQDYYSLIGPTKYGSPMNIFGTTPWQSTDVMAIHKDDLWTFSIRKWDDMTGPHQNDYHLMVIKGEDLARYVRNLNSITKYTAALGDIEGQVLSWIDIIAANGNPTQLTSALKKATELGVQHSKLVNRYSNKHGVIIEDFERWYRSKLFKWGLTIENAPTRINFERNNFYPTNEPAWLAAAMK